MRMKELVLRYKEQIQIPSQDPLGREGRGKFAKNKPLSIFSFQSTGYNR